MTTTEKSSVCKFYQLIPNAPRPRRADRSAEGTLPVNAYRYCEPIASASGFGWYLYPPLNFALMLDGTEILWTYEGAPGWYSLAHAAQFPNFVQTYREIAPPGLGEPPTFLAQGLLPGTVQIWSGYLARTAPGWALLSRGTANVLNKQAYENYEGIVETDTWFGPLFTNVKITRSNAPIEFHTRYPLFQVQPIPRPAYTDPEFDVLASTDMSLEDWTQFEETIRPNTNQMRRLGRYATETRKRLRGETLEARPE
jgi:Family of unknown function (DUF6065)